MDGVGREGETIEELDGLGGTKQGVGTREFQRGQNAWTLSRQMGGKQGDIIVKTDQEPSIECLVSGIRECREGGNTVVEEAQKEMGPGEK